MAMTKTAHADALKKIAEVDQLDSNNAVELGFLKAAQDMGLDEAQYSAFRQAAIELTTPPATK